MRVRKEINETIGLREMKKDIVYLGNSMIFGMNKTKKSRRLKNKL